MRGTAFTTGQMAELTSSLNGALVVALPKVAKKFGDPKAVLAGVKDKSEVLASRLEESLESVIKSMMTLIRRPQVPIIVSQSRDPDKFYKTGSGLWVYDDFRNLVVAKAKLVQTGAFFKVNADELGADLTDKEIEDGLPSNHLWDETALCAVISEMTSNQSKGEPGNLLNNGYANLFYTSSCVVRVGWNTVNRRWDVGTWDRADDTWNAGARVFSPAN